MTILSTGRHRVTCGGARCGKCLSHILGPWRIFSHHFYTHILPHVLGLHSNSPDAQLRLKAETRLFAGQMGIPLAIRKQPWYQVSPLLCLVNVHTKNSSQVSIALHALFTLLRFFIPIPSEKHLSWWCACCLLRFCMLCAKCYNNMVPSKHASVSMREKWAPLRSFCDLPKPTWHSHAEKAQYSKGANDIRCLWETYVEGALECHFAHTKAQYYCGNCEWCQAVCFLYLCFCTT